MPVDRNIFDFLNFEFDFVIKIFLILFLVFYNVFAFILYRQIQLMCHALHTPTSGILRFISIIHIGIALAILLAIIGLF